MSLTKVVYIDQSDFRLVDSKEYYGLAPNKTVGIKYAGHITCTNVITSSSGEVLELEVRVCACVCGFPPSLFRFRLTPPPTLPPSVSCPHVAHWLYSR